MRGAHRTRVNEFENASQAQINVAAMTSTRMQSGMTRGNGEGGTDMGLMHTTQSILPAWMIEVTSQSRTAPPSQCLTAHPQGMKRTTYGTMPKQAGEEGELIERALEGDLDALSILFARDRVRLYRAAFSLLHNREDAEDALQDGLLCAYLNLRSFEGRTQFSTWLTRIVLNAALMKRRKLRTLPQASLD